MAAVATSIGISLAVSAASAGIIHALTPTQKLEQGRLGDLTSPKSSYGQAIPWAWGTVRLPGNRIWQDFLEERVRTTGGGGKGSKVETSNYTYFGYFAELYCDCPFRSIVGYRRLWFNKKLVYSTVGGAETIAAGGRFAGRYLRFYNGRKAEYVDPLLQSVTGINNFSYGIPTEPGERNAFLTAVGVDPTQAILTPAYNYRAYIVAQRLPLQDFFKAIPKTEAEIIATENCTVADIIGDIMSLFYESDRYDVSLLTQKVTGFLIDSEGAAKNAIQTLQQNYLFDYVYSNGVYKFIPYDHPRNVVNLDRLDLNASVSKTSNGFDYEVTEADPAKLPTKVTLKYIDRDLDYDINSQSAEFEVKSNYSPNVVSLSSSLVLTGSQAATIATRILNLAWVQKYTYKFKLPPAYLTLEPADLIPNIFDSYTPNLKISQIRIGANLILDCEAVGYDPYFWDMSLIVLEQGGVVLASSDSETIAVDGRAEAVFNENGDRYVEGVDYEIAPDGSVRILEGTNIPPQTNVIVRTVKPAEIEDEGIIDLPVDTELLVLDIPLINNRDPDYTLYIAAGGNRNWRGCALYQSRDNSRYIYVTNIEQKSVYGTVTGISSNEDAPFELTVTGSLLELESVTDSDLDAGFNTVLCGEEILQFKTARLIDTGTYLLSEFTRGLFDTEQTELAIGDRFILLKGEDTYLTKVTIEPEAVGETRYFKAVSVGQTLDEVEPIEVSIEGRGVRATSSLESNDADLDLAYFAEVTQSRAISSADHNKILSVNSSVDITLDLDSSLVFPGFQVTIRKKGSGNVILNPGQDQILEAAGQIITTQHNAVYLGYVDNNIWIAIG